MTVLMYCCSEIQLSPCPRCTREAEDAVHLHRGPESRAWEFRHPSSFLLLFHQKVVFEFILICHFHFFRSVFYWSKGAE